MVKIIDGNQLAVGHEAELKKKVDLLLKKGIRLKLAVMVMKDDKAGQLYSRLKNEAAQRVGIEVVKHQFEDPRVDEIVEVIKSLNQDDKVQGIMVQRPGVKWGKRHDMSRQKFEVWWRKIVQVIEPKKDVDGLRSDSRFLLAVVRAALELKEYINGQVVVVGSKGLIGRRLTAKLKEEGIEVEGVDIGDKLKAKTIKADTVISATGKNNLIKASMVKKGAVIIDMGWPRGDVDFERVKLRAGVITPVPGGIGPLTVVSLLENLVDSVV